MKFTLTIETGNDAMLSGRHIAQALHEVALKIGRIGNIEAHGEDYDNRIGDANGNKVGTWGISE